MSCSFSQLFIDLEAGFSFQDSVEGLDIAALKAAKHPLATLRQLGANAVHHQPDHPGPGIDLSRARRGRGKGYPHMRFVEIALFLAPFVVFAAWRMATPVGRPSPRAVATSAALLALLFAALLWLHQKGAVPPNAAYVPATLQDGRIVPAHGAPR